MKGRVGAVAEDLALWGRGLLLRGTGQECPICGHGFRHFVHEGGSLRRRDRGYCPRCNSKARHRRVWLHCQAETDWFRAPTRLLHVAPERCTAPRLSRAATITYESVDIRPGRWVTTVASVTGLPHPDAHFDAVLCIHVLEHLDDDRAALAEMHRVLAPGGTAVINVPTDLHAPTYEDATITSPAGRRAAFGEPDHRRIYGSDLPRRLEEAGFVVTVHRADELPATTIARHGLTTDEHVFHCTRSGGPT